MKAHEQLLAHLIDGDGSAALSRRFHRGEVLRLCPRRYVLTQAWVRMSPSQRFVVTAHAAAQTHPQSALVGSSALFIRGFRMLRPEAVELSTPVGSRAGLHRNGFAVFGDSPDAIAARRVPAPPVRFTHIESIKNVIHHGASVEPTADALLRLLASGRGAHALAACDGMASALGRDSLSGWSAIEERLDTITRTATRERARGLVAASSSGAASVAESWSRFLILDAGFPAPELQAAHWDSRGLIGFSDFWWPVYGLVGEVDGIQKYVDPNMGAGLSTSQRIRREKARDNRLSAQVRRVVHWQWEDLARAGALVSILRAAGLPTDRRLRPWP